MNQSKGHSIWKKVIIGHSLIQTTTKNRELQYGHYCRSGRDKEKASLPV